MPNGGEHNCYNCRHLDPETSQCTLRNIPIKIAHWTTCRNMNKNSDVPYGPVYSIVCEVKDGAGSYGDIPWFQGNRVDTIQEPEGADTVVMVTDSNGKRHKFSNVAAYMEFWRKSTPKEEQ